MIFLEIVNGMNLFLEPTVSLILSLIEPCFEILLEERKIDFIYFLLHFNAYPFICFFICALANQIPYHLYFRHFTAIKLI